MGWRAQNMLMATEKLLRHYDISLAEFGDADDVPGRKQRLIEQLDELAKDADTGEETVRRALPAYGNAIIYELMIDLMVEKGEVPGLHEPADD